MVDTDIILAKASSVKKHLDRVKEKRAVDLQTFLKDLDRQEIILFNLQMAIQNCIDIAAHIISDEGLGVPGSTNDMFYLLEANGYLDFDTVEKMVRAVGFRNLIAHEYAKLDLNLVFKTAQKDIDDLMFYIQSIFKRLKLQDAST